MRSIFPLSQVVTTNVLRLVGLVGVATAAAGLVIGLWALNRIETVLDDTLQLVGTSLDALKSSSGLADTSLDSVRAGLDGIQGATDGMDKAFGQGQKVLENIGTLVEGDISTSIRQFDGTLPGLIQVAKVVDGAVQTLNQSTLNLPIADTAFTENLNGVQSKLIPIADNLKTQGKAIRETASALKESGDQVVKLNEEVSKLSETVAATETLLKTYDQTLEQGVESLHQTQSSMKTLLWVGRVFVVVLALSYAGLMAVPLQISAMARASLERRNARLQAAGEAGEGGEVEGQGEAEPGDQGQAGGSGESTPGEGAALAEHPPVTEPGSPAQPSAQPAPVVPLDLDVGPEANAPR